MPSGRRWLRWTVAVFALLVLAAGVASIPSIRRALADPAGRSPVAGVTDVEVRDDFLEYFAFTPSVIEVSAGTEVTWRFTSETEHDVVFERGASSDVLARGATWSRTFGDPGTYDYVCTLHEGMDGRVIVRPPVQPE